MITESPHRELRADAQRNLERVLDAAREVFAEEGFDACVTEIAERAGVGVGTIFRRFPTKEDLMAELLAQRGRHLIQVADEGLASDDPGAAFRRFITLASEVQISDRGFCDAVGTQVFARPELHEIYSTVMARVRFLLRRAISAGHVRGDVTAEDVALIMHGVAQTGLMVEDVAPGAWRRALSLALDGLRPEAATPLPRRPLTRRQLELARCGGDTV